MLTVQNQPCIAEIKTQDCYSAELAIYENEALANAKLIAAAPDLLEALKEMNEWVSINFPEHGMKHEFGTCASFNQMRAAIKLATE